MELPPLCLSLEENEARLEINSEISEALALGVEAALGRAFGYYKYEALNLRINSPGGSLLGLIHVLQCVQTWRLKGHQVHTQASFLAASAAALLLTLGEVGTRTVQKHSRLVFHHTRIGGSQTEITACVADNMATNLRRQDHRLLQRMASHVTERFGGTDGLTQEGLARCAHLRHSADYVAQDLDLEPQKNRKWLTRIEKSYRDCTTRGSTAPYQNLLAGRLKMDTGMDLREAYALLLIDCAFQSTALLPNARAHATAHAPAIRPRLAAH